MGQPVARHKMDKAKCPADGHGCNGCTHSVQGPCVSASPDVFVNDKGAIREGDPGIHTACCGPNTWNAKGCSGTVIVNGKGVHREGDATTHCGGSGTMSAGSDDVTAGG